MEWYIDVARYSNGRYYVDGQEMPYCTRSGSKRDLDSNTSHGYLAALGTIRCYVTESVLTVFRASSEWESLKPRILGVVPNDYATRYNVGGDFPYCWDLKEGVVPEPLPYPDPCEGVICEDVCDNTNLHEGVCEGGSCIRGRIIETDSSTCGYIPPPICNNGEMRGKITCEDGSIIYGEICENNAWIPTNSTCPTGPTPEPELDRTPWDMIALAGIGVVILYLIMRR